MKKFKWIAKSDDGAFEDESTKVFDSKKDCYEDMRNHALEKMKWNTEYDDDFSDLLDDDYIGYEVKFKQDEIVHTSYSGVYTYKIIENMENEEKLSQRLTKQYFDCTQQANDEVRRILNNVEGNKIILDGALDILVILKSGEIEEHRCKSIYIENNEICFDFGWIEINECNILRSEWLDILSEVECYE